MSIFDEIKLEGIIANQKGVAHNANPYYEQAMKTHDDEIVCFANLWTDGWIEEAMRKVVF